MQNLKKLISTRLVLSLFGLSLAINLVSIENALAAGDAANGEKIFNKCKACHATTAGVNKIGASLFGVMGSDIAKVSGYQYSDGVLAWAKGKKWDDATMDAWLTNPRKIVPTTKMTFPGLPKESDRADIIAYLKTLK